MNSIILDNHVCLPFHRDREFVFECLNLHRQAGFTVISINIGCGDMSWDSHIGFAEKLRNWIEQRPEQYHLIQSRKELIEKENSGDQRLGIFFDVEGGSLLNGDSSRLSTLYNLGVRWMCLTYNKSNDLVGGCLPGPADGGLTPIGREVVEEMDRLGIIVCCSHTGHRSAMELIAHTRNPAIFSHSNSAAVYPHWRNIDDTLAKMCADKGGVICLNGVGPFIGSGRSDLAGFLIHLDYLIDLVGPSHVGIGLDYVYDTQELEDCVQENPSLFGDSLQGAERFTFVPPTALPEIQAHLIQRGLNREEVHCILGGNLVRVASEVWN